MIEREIQTDRQTEREKLKVIIKYFITKQKRIIMTKLTKQVCGSELLDVCANQLRFDRE